MPVDINWLVSVIAALGGGVFIKEAVVGLWKWATKGQERERNRYHELERQADTERKLRYKWEAYGHKLTLILIINGLQDQIPKTPDEEDDEELKEVGKEE